MPRIPWFIALMSFAVVGCRGASRHDAPDAGRAEQPDRPSLAVPLGGGPMSVAGALNVLANARCQREEGCGRVGQGKTYRDRAACERTSLQAHAHDVSLLQCKGGIDGKKLETCASKLRAMTCQRQEVAASELCGTARFCLRE